jgi:outer membrane lipoprotein-sorting protein
VRHFLLTSTVMLVCAQFFLNAQTAAADATGAEIGTDSVIKNAVNGSAMVSTITNAVKSLKSYSFHADIQEKKDGKLTESFANFFVKTPNMMRVEIGGHGPKAGSKLVRNGSGIIKFKGGPALFGITMTMDADSRLLRLPSGRLVTECDYVSLMQDLSKQMASGVQVVTNPSAINLGEAGDVIVLETHDPGTTAVSQRICVDPKTKVPIRWIRFKDGQLDGIAKFEELQLNPNEPDDMFNI